MNLLDIKIELFGNFYGELFDYAACLFLEGNVGPKYTFLFNHEDIRKIIFTGYENEEELDYNKQF